MSDRNFRRILLIRRKALGDALVTMPAVLEVVRAWPAAQIDLVIDRPFAPLFEGLDPRISILAWPRPGGGSWVRFLRRQGYDLVVDWLGSPRTALWTALSGAPVRAGFDTAGKNRAGLFTHSAPRDPDTRLSREVVWLPEGDLISYEALKGLQLSPVPLPVTDVLTGLQTGLIDIVAIPPVVALALQWHTKVKYMTELPLVYTLGFMAVDKRAFNKLDEADQQVVPRSRVLRRGQVLVRRGDRVSPEVAQTLRVIDSQSCEVTEYSRVLGVGLLVLLANLSLITGFTVPTTPERRNLSSPTYTLDPVFTNSEYVSSAVPLILKLERSDISISNLSVPTFSPTFPLRDRMIPAEGALMIILLRSSSLAARSFSCISI